MTRRGTRCNRGALSLVRRRVEGPTSPATRPPETKAQQAQRLRDPPNVPPCCICCNSAVDQDSRDGVPQSVQRDVAVAMPAGEGAEPVPQGRGPQPTVMIKIGAEQPRPERTVRAVLTGTFLPDADAVLPQLRGLDTDADPTAPTGLGRRDDLIRGAPVHVQDPAVQVLDLQRGQLPAPGTGVGDRSSNATYSARCRPTALPVWAACIMSPAAVARSSCTTSTATSRLGSG